MVLNDAPRFDALQASRIAREVFGIDAVAQPLTSERDQNFLVTEPGGGRRVLKIANASERAEMLEAQQAAMTHVASHTSLCPRPLTTTAGGPGDASTNITYLIFKQALLGFDVGVASAGALFAVVLANIVAAFLMRLVGKNLER